MIDFSIANVPDPAPGPTLAVEARHDGMGGVEFTVNGFPVYGIGADGRGTRFTGLPATLGMTLAASDDGLVTANVAL